MTAQRRELTVNPPGQYRATDYLAPGPGKLELVFTPADGGKPTAINVYDFKSAGVALAMYNTDEVSLADV